MAVLLISVFIGCAYKTQDKIVETNPGSVNVDSSDYNEIEAKELADKLEDSHKKITLYNTTDIIHKLSHQELHIKFWIINTTKSTKNGIKWSDIGTLPVPIVIERFINNFQL